MNLNLNIYFFLFLAVFTIRNLLEKVLNHKKENKNNLKNKGTVSLILFIVSYIVSGIAVGILLLIDSSVNIYLYLIGIFIFIFAFLDRILTLKVIGDSYSQSIEPISESRLITSGIYSIIRHPLYIFYAFEMIGLLMIKFNYISFCALIIYILAVEYRTKREELLLYNKYGEKYVNYRKITKKYIPYIY